jgi:hypothetical protein
VRWVLSAVRNCGGGCCFCCHTLTSALFLYSNNCSKLKALVTPLIAMTLQFDPASCFAFNGSLQKAKLAAAAAARALRTTACDAPLLIATAPPSATATMAPVLVENREPSAEVRTHMQLRARGRWVSEASKRGGGGLFTRGQLQHPTRTSECQCDSRPMQRSAWRKATAWKQRMRRWCWERRRWRRRVRVGVQWRGSARLQSGGFCCPGPT